MHTGEEDRQRRGSVTTIGTSKRRRDDDESEDDGGYIRIRQELEDYIFNENNKVSKTAAKNILANIAKLEAENIQLRVRVSKLEGQLLERRMESRETAMTKKTFAEAVGSPKTEDWEKGGGPQTNGPNQWSWYIRPMRRRRIPKRQRKC